MISELFAIALASSSASVSDIKVEGCEFGEAYAFSAASCSATVSNFGSEDAKIRVLPEWHNDHVPHPKLTIAAGAKVSVPVHLSLENQLGEASHFFRVVDERSPSEKHYIQAKGFVISSLDDVRPSLDLGSIRNDRRPLVSAEVLLSSREVENFRITKIIEVPSDLDVSITDDGKGLIVTPVFRGRWRAYDGAIKVTINTPSQKEAWIAVRANIHGPVAPKENPISVGAIQNLPGEVINLTEVRQLEGEELRLGRISSRDLEAKVRVTGCVIPDISCRALSMVFDSSARPGPFRGSVSLQILGLEESLEIDVSGILVEGQAASTPAGDSRSVTERSGSVLWEPSIFREIEMNARPVAKTKQPAPAAVKADRPLEPEGRGPLLRWTAKDERAVYGYQIYRSVKEAGPFLLVNSPTLRIESKSADSTSHAWRDLSAVSGQTYWYYVGVIYMDGHKGVVTSPVKAVAK